jgi:hypothetical protein
VHVRAPGLAEEWQSRFDGVVCPDEIDLDHGAEGSFGETRDGREAAGVSGVLLRTRGVLQRQKDGSGSGRGSGMEWNRKGRHGLTSSRQLLNHISSAQCRAGFHG